MYEVFLIAVWILSGLGMAAVVLFDMLTGPTFKYIRFVVGTFCLFLTSTFILVDRGLL